MNPDDRLATLVAALESVGLSCLVMGGHAVRHYGLWRYTNDFDFTIAPDGWEVVRRQYKAACQDRDRADKEAIGAAGREPPE